MSNFLNPKNRIFNIVFLIFLVIYNFSIGRVGFSLMILPFVVLNYIAYLKISKMTTEELDTFVPSKIESYLYMSSFMLFIGMTIFLNDNFIQNNIQIQFHGAANAVKYFFLGGLVFMYFTSHYKLLFQRSN